MTFRFMVSLDNGATYSRQVTPAGVAEDLIDWEKDQTGGRASKRKVMSGALTFSSRDDFQFFKDLDTDGAHCDTIRIRIDLKCGADWNELWTGQFAKGGGKWDLDNCIFEVKPEPVDKFTCIEDNWEIKQNILNANSNIVNIVALPGGMEIAWGVSDPVPVSQYGWALVDSQTINLPAAGACSASSQTNNIYWRETTYTECVNGSLVPPNGDGWEDAYNQGLCADGQLRKWGRIPTVAWPFPNDPLVLGPVVGPSTVDVPLPTSPSCTTWIPIQIVPVCLGGYRAGLYLCLESANVTTEIPRARTIKDAMEFLLSKLDCGIEGIRSDFFDWNAPGDTVGYAPGINYVTGDVSKVDHLLFLDKTDAISPGSSQAATLEEWTLKDMIRTLQTMFQVLWDIDDEGYFRIEHYSWWFSQAGINTSAYTAIERMLYESLSSEIPRVEKCTFQESLGLDFVGKDIVYSGACVKSGTDKEISHRVGNAVTDISMILGDPDSVSRDGIVILATTFNGADYDVILEFGVLTGTPATNVALSWAHLHRDYWTWNRFLPNGNMNGQDVTFDGFIPNISQQDIIIKCFDCDAIDFESNYTVGTKLGTYFGGIRAQVEKATLQRNGNLKLSVRYSR